MSIIIRLQNLPWAANALDIRQFFHGLQIPEGGVHIVGGELGDAFIAFSTDEDARQAFLRTDGKIKGIQIKLMLSSRTEMQRVIEQARSQSMAAFMLPTTPISQPAQVSATPLPAAVPQLMPAAVPALDNNSKNRDADSSDRRKRRSRSKSKDRRDRSRERSRDKSRDRSRDRRDRRHRDRSRSKSRDRRDRRRRDRSRNRSRDRESRSSRRDKPRDKRDEKDLPYGNQKDVKKTEAWDSRPPLTPQVNIITPADLLKSGQGIIAASPWNVKNDLSNLSPVVSSNMTGNLKDRNINGAPRMAPNNPQPSIRYEYTNTTENWPSANPPSVREAFGRGVAPFLNRGGGRGPYIPPNRGASNVNPQISKVDIIDLDSDDYAADGKDVRPKLESPRGDLRSELNPRRSNGRRSRFEDLENPVNACVALEPFFGSYGDLRRFFQGLSINYRGIKILNDEVGRKTGTCLVQFREEYIKKKALDMDGLNFDGSNIKIKHISDQVFEEAIDRYNPRMDANPYEDNLGRVRNTKKFLNNEPEIKNFVCLKVEDLPTYVKEQDILHIFSQHPLISLHLDLKPKGGTIAYVKFSTHEVAELALGEKSHHIIHAKPVTVKPCSDEEFNKVNQLQVTAFEESKPKETVPKTEASIIETDCLSISNLPPKTSDRDISDFFSDIGIIPLKIHLMSNDMGFTGQAYCEFESNEETKKAIAKNEETLGQNTIKVLPILRSEMEGVLGSSVPRPNIAPEETLPPATPMPSIEMDSKSSEPEAPVALPVVPFSGNNTVVPISTPYKKVNIPVESLPEKEVRNMGMNERKGLPEPLFYHDEYRENFSMPAERETRMPMENIHSHRPVLGRNFAEDPLNNGPPRGPRNDYFRDHFAGSRGGRQRGGPSRAPFPRGNFEPRGHGFIEREMPRPHHEYDAEERLNYDYRYEQREEEREMRFNHSREEGDDEARPGCTVYMENVPYKAGTVEILNFFKGYNCTHNVSRRYNQDNMPSGEAKVTFYTPEEAYRAVRELDGMQIWDRSIYLTQQ